MLRVRDLSYRDILHSIDFSVPDGSFTVIAGRNGSGKSCLLRCIKGLYRHQGEVTASGSCALVFQDTSTQIIGQTVRRDLEFGLDRRDPQREHKVMAAARTFGLEQLLDRRPSTLSGGERRRLAIADVCLTGADILLLDEPFANLDYPGIRSVITLLKELHARGRTIVLVSHEVDKVLALADYIIILDNGRIAEQGPADEVFTTADWGKYGIRISGPREAMLWD